ELNSRRAEPVPLDRFRANVVVDGSDPWIEDGWAILATPEAQLRLVKPCARCAVITTDQRTGQRSKEPTATLATYRWKDGKVLVGMNALAGPPDAFLRVGDPLSIDAPVK
ncbi:MAG: MOSC domain-containing protein, partial [Bacteroidetes bacterium]|nr:MOSC domain-containing protein [Bacteroidota bacterium]